MTVEEKAKDIYNKIWNEFPAQSAMHFDLKPFVKQCALISVDEMQKVHEEQLRYMVGWLGGITHSREVKKYYEDLKTTYSITIKFKINIYGTLHKTTIAN